MNWVEELKPDDDVTVEIIFPKPYVEYNIKTMPKYASAIAHLCKAAAILGEDYTEFLIFGMTIMQIDTIERVFKKNFHVEMTHDYGHLPDGKRWAYFYADVRGLQELMKGES